MKASGCTTAKLHLTYASDRYKGNHMQSGNSLAESIAAVSDVAIPLNKIKDAVLATENVSTETPARAVRISIINY